MMDAGTLHVMGFVALAGADVTTQLRFTSPAKPLLGVAVMGAVLPVVLPAEIAIELVFSVKPACETVIVPEPEVPR